MSIQKNATEKLSHTIDDEKNNRYSCGQFPTFNFLELGKLEWLRNDSGFLKEERKQKKKIVFNL